MPTRPPSAKATSKGPKLTGFTKRRSRHARGYGRDHALMRARVLVEEPLCRECLKHDRVSATEVADHIVPKAEGGTDDRENYQGLCRPCDRVKTAREAARARARNR
jgi:5-methylcytosine-specific restriction protein A